MCSSKENFLVEDFKGRSLGDLLCSEVCFCSCPSNVVWRASLLCAFSIDSFRLDLDLPLCDPCREDRCRDEPAGLLLWLLREIFRSILPSSCFTGLLSSGMFVANVVVDFICLFSSFPCMLSTTIRLALDGRPLFL